MLVLETLSCARRRRADHNGDDPMATDTLDHAAQQAEAARKSAEEAVETGRAALNEAMAAAEKVFVEGAKRAERQLREGEKVLKENLDRLRDQAKTYGDTASQSMDDAQKYVVERVKERPLMSTVAGLGVGFLLGVLLSGRNR
jgi:ElaB/YqjD/DUF883 family membrane-anchored ribosome-binding protein